MSLPTYDSPTFLGKRDVYLLGLTMPQIAVAGGVALVWLLVAMMFDMTMQMRLIIFGPQYLFTLAMVFIKPFGLYLPVLGFLAVKYLFVKPSYECSDEMLLDGPVEEMATVDGEELTGPRAALAKIFPFMRKVSRDDNFEARRAEAQAEASRQADEAMRNARSGAFDLVKSLWKG